MKITPLANTRKTWVSDTGEKCRYTRSGEPRLVVRLSTFMGPLGGQHWYCRVRGDEPEVLVGNRVVFLGGHSDAKPYLDYSFDANRILYTVEKDLMGSTLGKVGDTTSRFNDPESALRAGVQCAKDNFADTAKHHWRVKFEGPIGKHFDLATFRLDVDADEILNTVVWPHWLRLEEER